MARYWIKSAIKHPGALRRAAKVKKGAKLTAKKLKVLARRKGVTGRRARLAMTLSRLRRH